MGVRLPILALVGVGTARKTPGERFGTVVDGVTFLEIPDFRKLLSTKHAFLGNHCGQKMISYLIYMSRNLAQQIRKALSFDVSKYVIISPT